MNNPNYCCELVCKCCWSICTCGKEKRPWESQRPHNGDVLRHLAQTCWTNTHMHPNTHPLPHTYIYKFTINLLNSIPTCCREKRPWESPGRVMGTFWDSWPRRSDTSLMLRQQHTIRYSGISDTVWRLSSTSAIRPRSNFRPGPKIQEQRSIVIAW